MQFLHDPASAEPFHPGGQLQAVMAEKISHLLPPAGKTALQLLLEFALVNRFLEKGVQPHSVVLPPVRELAQTLIKADQAFFHSEPFRFNPGPPLACSLHAFVESIGG